MKISQFLVYIRYCFTIIFCVWLIFSPVPKRSENNNSSIAIIETIPRGGAQISSKNSKPENFKLGFHQLLEQQFPDSQSRMDYQQKQEIIYKSAMIKKNKIKDVRMVDRPINYTIEQGTASQTLTNKKSFRAMLRQHFPDWGERVAYEQKMGKLYLSGTKRLAEAKRIGSMAKLSPEEQDAFDYINGTGVYKEHQDPKTSPNMFDSRRSFLLKMEDDKMRNRFLESYNRRETLD